MLFDRIYRILRIGSFSAFFLTAVLSAVALAKVEALA
jgi:hypothetical protein